MNFDFPKYVLTEFPDVNSFLARAGKWLALREAENFHMYPAMELIADAAARDRTPGKLFILEDRERIVAAACITPDRTLFCTWGTQEIVAILVEKFAATQHVIEAVHAPAFTAWDFAQGWGGRKQMRWEAGRETRVYQLSRLTYTPPPAGRLENAMLQDLPMLGEWIERHAEETQQAMVDGAALAEALIAARRLFVWKNPGPVAMVACPTPTPHGGLIELIYAPPAMRGKGHGKAAIGALAHLMISTGRRYCFFCSDIQDRRANRLFQSLGARTISEMLRCSLHPQAEPVVQTR